MFKDLKIANLHSRSRTSSRVLAWPMQVNTRFDPSLTWHKKTQKNKTLKIISQSPVYYNLTWYQKKTRRIKLIKCCPNLLSIRGEDTKDTKDTKTNEK